jgi:hypothetical protein
MCRVSVDEMRRVRREWSARLRDAPAAEVLAVADSLVDEQRWVAYELVYHHQPALMALDPERVERLGRGLDSWGATDAFGRYISGPAWRLGRISAVRRFLAENDVTARVRREVTSKLETGLKRRRTGP